MTDFEQDVQAVRDERAAPIAAAQREAAPIRAEAEQLLKDATRLINTLRPRFEAVRVKHAEAQTIGVCHSVLDGRFRMLYGDGYANQGLLVGLPAMCQALLTAIDRLSPYELYQEIPRTWPSRLANLKTCLGSLEETLRLIETQDLPELVERVKAARRQPAGAVTALETPARLDGSSIDTEFEVR